MAITAIRSFKNFQGTIVYWVRDHENLGATGGPGRKLDVAPGQTIQCNIWVPWCVSHDDFVKGNHYIQIVGGDLVNSPLNMCIWQQGDYVRYSRDGVFHDNGDLVPGNCTAGGDRSVEILGTSDWDAELRFY